MKLAHNMRSGTPGSTKVDRSTRMIKEPAENTEKGVSSTNIQGISNRSRKRHNQSSQNSKKRHQNDRHDSQHRQTGDLTGSMQMKPKLLKVFASNPSNFFSRSNFKSSFVLRAFKKSKEEGGSISATQDSHGHSVNTLIRVQTPQNELVPKKRSVRVGLIKID